MANNWTPTDFRQEEKLYLGIARAIEADIGADILKPGDVLPTHRELADRLGVAIGTVTKAYREAENRSLIVGRGRRGTFVRSQDASESRLSAAADLWSCDDEPVYNLPYGARVPDFSGLLRRFMSRPIEDPGRFWPPESDRPQHCETGVRWLAKYGIQVSEDDIIPTMGNHHGLLVALANECSPGDTMVTEQHSFISLPAIAELLHLKIDGLDADDEGMMPDAFESACRRERVKVVYCQPCVQNPTNASMSGARRRAIVGIAQRYGVAIIEDEVTRPIAVDPPPLLKSLAPDQCYLLTSPSKRLTPGIKIGYMVPPSGARKSALSTRRATMAFMGGLPSELLDQMLQDGSADKHIEACKREGRMRQQLAQENLPSEFVRTNPASYFVWLHLPEHWPAAAFAAELYRRGIPAWAAETYAADPARATRAVRFNIGQSPNQAAFLKSIQRIAGLLESSPRPWAAD